VRVGKDRTEEGFPGGTRHPCPFCDWYLDAEPVSDVLMARLSQSLHEVLSKRLEAIHIEILRHMGTEHPGEYRDADQITVEGTYRDGSARSA
jgi:hypothetical protein